MSFQPCEFLYSIKSEPTAKPTARDVQFPLNPITSPTRRPGGEKKTFLWWTILASTGFPRIGPDFHCLLTS
jgi:hypothetical protein